jgi:OFA family oxalate/formate antiporter-like MFS transporter
MSTHGITAFQMFGWLGLVFLLVVVAAGSAMEYAPEFSARAHVQLGIRSILKERAFRLLYLGMVTGLAAGFAVNANLKELSPVQSVGILAVALFAVANALGRLVWGFLFDRMSAGTALRLDLVLQALVLTGGLLVISGQFWFLAFAVLAGFNYGGVLVLYASTTARLWGTDRVGEVYGVLFSANIVASPAPVLAGYCMDAFGTFVPAILGFAALLIIGAVVVGDQIPTTPAHPYR